jgi:hypothetical protein
MRSRWKAVLVAGASLALMVAAVPVMAGIPDLAASFYVPQSGTTTSPSEGTTASRFFRMCPNNDGFVLGKGASLPNSARIKVVIRDVNNNPIPNIAAADICVLFNGGTAAQGFTGSGADSVIANSTWNSSPLCPDVRCVAADAPTDVNGVTYITFAGADVNTPGVSTALTRNANRKWGHYDTAMPVFCLGFQLSGRNTSASANGTYVLRVKNFDWTGGLAALANQGETVTSADFNGVANGIGVSNAISYWRDFDYSGSVQTADFNAVNAHVGDNCAVPQNP